MFLIARLELSYGGVQEFMAIAPRVRSAMEAGGCRMLHAFMQQTGRLNTFIHIWEMADANNYIDAVESLRQSEDISGILAGLSKSVVDQTLTFATALPYSPDA